MIQQRHAVFLAACTALFGMMLYADIYLLLPFERAASFSAGEPVGNRSDLYPRWLGARELLLYGRNPYSPEVTQRIQAGYYGRALGEEKSAHPRDEQRFAYPLYAVFLLAPFVWMPFMVVRYIFTALLIILCIWSVLVWPSVMGLRWNTSIKVGVALLVLSTLQVMQGVSRLQLSLVVFALLSSAVWFTVRRHFWLAGILLAIGTIKPQLIVLPGIFLLMWSLASHNRRNLLIGFVAALATLLVAAELIQRGWVTAFFYGVVAYHRYAAGSPLEFLFPPFVAWIFILAALAFTAVRFWQSRNAPATSPEFQGALALGMSITTLVVPIGGGYNHIFLLPAFVVLYSNRHKAHAYRPVRLLLGSPWILVVLPWLTVLTLIAWGGIRTPNDTIFRLPFLFAFLLPFFVTAAMAVSVRKPSKTATLNPLI
jgi:hypothetical protein